MKSRFIVSAFTALLCLGVFSDRAMAAWYLVHGTSGHVEDEASVSFSRTGVGLGIKPQWAPSTWVHFAVPTLGGTTSGAQYVTLKFVVNTANDSLISRVRVYNGNLLVKAFPVSWSTLGYQSKTLDLGSVRSFPRGMGLSVEITAGPDSGIDEYLFVGAGANFVPIP